MNPDVERKIDEIKSDREHGAGWLSREAMATMNLAAEKSGATNTHDFLKDLEATAERLTEARPSMVAIKNLVARFIYQLSEKSEDNIDVLRSLARSMGDRLIRDSEEATINAASLASSIIEDGDRIMSCSYSSTVCQAFKLAKDRGKQFYVVVADSRTSEGRVYGEITAGELTSLGIYAEVIADSLIADTITRTTKVMVGADTILRDGSLINGTPTSELALAAKKANIPFYTVCETSKLDFWCRPGRQAHLEEGFDSVSYDLITGIITEAGMLKPDELINIMERGTGVNS